MGSRHSKSMVESNALLPSEHHKSDVIVYSCNRVEDIRGFIHQIELSHVIQSVTYGPLPFNISDLNNFNFKSINRKGCILILCHSTSKNRGFALTDVDGALYNKFLPNAKKYFGRSHVCVIVHDLPEAALSPECMETKMKSFRSEQKTTLSSSSLLLICGDLLTPTQLVQLQQFCINAGRAPSTRCWECCIRNTTKIDHDVRPIGRPTLYNR